jgi:hypothetical protein
MSQTTSTSNALRYVAGPLFLAVCAAGYNAVAYRHKRPTISEGVRWVARQGGGTEVAGAIIGGLLAHWLLNNDRERSL